MKEINPSARVQLRSVGQLLHPAVCALCGNGTSATGYADPAIFYDWEGQVYFCKSCTVEMAEVFGCLPPDEAEFIIKQNEELAEKLALATEELQNATSRLNVFDAVLTAAVNSGSISDSLLPNQQTAPELPEVPDAGGKEAEPVATEPVKKRRPNDAARTTGGNGADPAFLL